VSEAYSLSSAMMSSDDSGLASSANTPTYSSQHGFNGLFEGGESAHRARLDA
jgi:hypothetical protein